MQKYKYTGDSYIHSKPLQVGDYILAERIPIATTTKHTTIETKMMNAQQLIHMYYQLSRSFPRVVVCTRATRKIIARFYFTPVRSKSQKKGTNCGTTNDLQNYTTMHPQPHSNLQPK